MALGFVTIDWSSIDQNQSIDRHRFASISQWIFRSSILIDCISLGEVQHTSLSSQHNLSTFLMILSDPPATCAIYKDQLWLYSGIRVTVYTRGISLSFKQTSSPYRRKADDDCFVSEPQPLSQTDCHVNLSVDELTFCRPQRPHITQTPCWGHKKLPAFVHSNWPNHDVNPSRESRELDSHSSGEGDLRTNTTAHKNPAKRWPKPQGSGSSRSNGFSDTQGSPRAGARFMCRSGEGPGSLWGWPI